MEGLYYAWVLILTGSLKLGFGEDDPRGLKALFLPTFGAIPKKTLGQLGFGLVAFDGLHSGSAGSSSVPSSLIGSRSAGNGSLAFGSFGIG